MDLLFHEYASPFLLLDGVIATGRFVEFIDTFEKQADERFRWDYYIHKIPPWNDITWEDFNRQLGVTNTPVGEVTMSKEQLETTIQYSYNMMKDFEIGQQERG